MSDVPERGSPLTTVMKSMALEYSADPVKTATDELADIRVGNFAKAMDNSTHDPLAETGRDCICGDYLQPHQRGNAAVINRSTSQGDQERFDQHSHTGRAFRCALKAEQTKLERAISRADADDISQPRANRA